MIEYIINNNKRIFKSMKQINYITTMGKIPNFRLNNNQKLICGDLHGNFIKLLDYLIICNFIEINEMQYIEIIHDFNNINFNRNIKTSFEQDLYYNHIQLKTKTILAKINFKCSKNELILLGDVFGDRNEEDILKLALIKKLNTSTNNKLTILFGNHDNAAFNILNNLSADCLPCVSDFLFLNKLQKKELFNDFKEIIKKNYTLIKKLDNLILSHAPIRLDVFNCFKTNDDNLHKICNNINGFFEKLSNFNLKEEQLFNYLIWDRYNAGNMYLKDKYIDILQICGHDTFIDDKNRLLSLNNMNGKIKNNFEIEYLLCF